MEPAVGTEPTVTRAGMESPRDGTAVLPVVADSTIPRQANEPLVDSMQARDARDAAPATIETAAEPVEIDTTEPSGGHESAIHGVIARSPEPVGSAPEPTPRVAALGNEQTRETIDAVFGRIEAASGERYEAIRNELLRRDAQLAAANDARARAERTALDSEMRAAAAMATARRHEPPSRAPWTPLAAHPSSRPADPCSAATPLAR